MYKFAVKLKMLPGKEGEFLAALREFLPTVSAEEGTIQYDVCQGADDPTDFIFFEAYVDEAASEAHQNSPEFKAFVGKIGALAAAPPLLTRLAESAK